MAQHIPIANFKQKRFKEIEKGIQYAFSRSPWGMITSMTYRYINDQDGNEVYLLDRKIPKNIIYSHDNMATFEIHYNKNQRKIIHIYLVA